MVLTTLIELTLLSGCSKWSAHCISLRRSNLLSDAHKQPPAGIDSRSVGLYIRREAEMGSKRACRRGP